MYIHTYTYIHIHIHIHIHIGDHILYVYQPRRLDQEESWIQNVFNSLLTYKV
jgi:hypothetical protein